MADASASLNIQYERKSRQVALGYWDLADSEIAVLRSCTLTIGSRHPSDFGQVLTDIDVEIVSQQVNREGDSDKSNLWKVTASYGPWNPAELGDPGQAGNPFAVPARVRLEWQSNPEPIWVDVNGNYITNTAGDAFDPPVSRDTLIGLWTVERSETTSLDIPTLLALGDKVNDSPWNGFAAKSVRTAPIGLPALEYSQEANVYYWPMTYVFMWNPKGWDQKPLNAGYRQRSPSQQNQNRMLTILDDSGQPLASPGLLDKNGAYLPPPVAQKSVIIGSFDIYEAIDFGVFNMDGLFTPPAVLS